MSGNVLKDLFVQQRYDEVIDALKIIYSNLFVDMLKYKEYGTDKNLKELEYDELYMIVKSEYPRYDKELRYMSNAGFNPDNSYLDVINKMLSVYTYMMDTYKEEWEADSYEAEEDEDFVLYDGEDEDNLTEE